MLGNLSLHFDPSLSFPLSAHSVDNAKVALNHLPFKLEIVQAQDKRADLKSVISTPAVVITSIKYFAEE